MWFKTKIAKLTAKVESSRKTHGSALEAVSAQTRVRNDACIEPLRCQTQQMAEGSSLAV